MFPSQPCRRCTGATMRSVSGSCKVLQVSQWTLLTQQVGCHSLKSLFDYCFYYTLATMDEVKVSHSCALAWECVLAGLPITIRAAIEIGSDVDWVRLCSWQISFVLRVTALLRCQWLFACLSIWYQPFVKQWTLFVCVRGMNCFRHKASDLRCTALPSRAGQQVQQSSRTM